MNLELCLIYLQLSFKISNTGSVEQSVKYYVLNSISDYGKLDKPAPVTFLRFHPNNTADPWIVYKKPSWEPKRKNSLTNEKNTVKIREKDVLNGKVLRVTWSQSGYFSEFYKALERMGNFTVQYINQSGYNNPGIFNDTSKTWNGAIGLLLNDQVDVATHFYIITSNKREAVDISITLMTLKPCLLIKRPSNTISFARTAYLQPFAIKTWCGMLLLIFVAMVLLTFMKKIAVQKFHYGRYMPKQFLQLWGIFCQQGLSEFPRTLSHGIVYYAILWFGIIIYSLYSSLIVSDMLSNSDGLPFSSLEEFAKNKLYPLQIVRGSVFHADLKNPDYSEIYPYNMLRNKLPKDEDLAISGQDFRDKICREKVAGLVLNMFYKSDYDQYKCSLAYVCASWPRIHFSIAFQKNGPYTQALNYYILRLKAEGVLDHINNRIMHNEKKTNLKEDSEVIYMGVTVSDILTLFSIGLASFILPLIVLFFENIPFLFYEKQTAIATRRSGDAQIRNEHISV